MNTPTTLELIHEILLNQCDRLQARVHTLAQKTQPRLLAARMAESVFQDACLRAIEQAERYDQSQSFHAWFLHLASNELIQKSQRIRNRFRGVPNDVISFTRTFG